MVIVTVVIAAMSFYLIALVVWMALRYRTVAAVPPELVRDIRNLLEQNKYNEAYHRLLADSSFLARVLASGVRKLPAGLSRRNGPRSWPTKMQRWIWSTGRLISQPLERSGP